MPFCLQKIPHSRKLGTNNQVSGKQRELTCTWKKSVMRKVQYVTNIILPEIRTLNEASNVLVTNSIVRYL